jgi:hypothetical protein
LHHASDRQCCPLAATNIFPLAEARNSLDCVPAQSAYGVRAPLAGAAGFGSDRR